MNTAETVLMAKNISKSFQGLRALKNASFEVRRGEAHALIGENGAGKSTLMKIFLGIYRADSGEIIFKGKPVSFKNPNEALHAGISMIHQEISLIPSMTVAENIWLGRERDFYYKNTKIISEKKRNEATAALLNELGAKLSPKDVVGELSVANMQLVEIARAVSYNSDVIIMDEPTSALTESEVKLLYKIIRDLLAKNVAVIFISHKLEEIFDICQRVTVMRDGEFVGVRECKDVTQPELIRLIVGRELSELFPKLEAEIGEPVLEVEGLCGDRFRDISFTVRSGEILGFCGLMGAGRTEIMRALFGVDKLRAGTVKLFGKPIKVKSPKESIANGMTMLTEDRLRLGAISTLSVKKNLSLAYLRTITGPLTFVDGKRETADTDQMRERMAVKTSSMSQTISALSGGNQQKVLIGRCLLTKPKLLILDEPTRGIDVGSKSEIHRMISKLAQEGVAIILVSSELPEVMGMSDRIIVIREGRAVYEARHGEATQEELIRYSFGEAQ